MNTPFKFFVTVPHTSMKSKHRTYEAAVKAARKFNNQLSKSYAFMNYKCLPVPLAEITDIKGNII